MFACLSTSSKANKLLLDNDNAYSPISNAVQWTSYYILTTNVQYRFAQANGSSTNTTRVVFHTLPSEHD